MTSACLETYTCLKEIINMRNRSWFDTEVDGNLLRIRFNPCVDRFWEPRVMADVPLPVFPKGGVVELLGAGAMWMFAHAAARATVDGAADISVISAASDGTWDDETSSDIHLSVRTNESSLTLDNLAIQGLIETRLASPPYLTPAAIARLIEPAVAKLQSMRLRDLCLTGNGSAGIYAKLASAAVVAGVESLSYYSPRTGQLQILSLHENCPPLGASLVLDNWLQDRLECSVPGIVIGVAGDPNTGKSVFSSLLDYHRRKDGTPGWRLDCDAQAPTPPWYLRSRASGMGAEAEVLRQKLKRDWTGNMEVALSEQLENMKHSLPVSIADLPGGNHHATPPQRLPPGRERLFSPVDSLIVIQPADNPTAELWREELEHHQMANRIKAVITSVAPEAGPSLTGRMIDGIWRGEARGLDRSRLMEEVYPAMLPAIGELWKVLVNGNGSSLANK
jgi:hypothetical protein